MHLSDWCCDAPQRRAFTPFLSINHWLAEIWGTKPKAAVFNEKTEALCVFDSAWTSCVWNYLLKKVAFFSVGGLSTHSGKCGKKLLECIQESQIRELNLQITRYPETPLKAVWVLEENERLTFISSRDVEIEPLLHGYRDKRAWRGGKWELPTFERVLCAKLSKYAVSFFTNPRISKKVFFFYDIWCVADSMFDYKSSFESNFFTLTVALLPCKGPTCDVEHRGVCRLAQTNQTLWLEVNYSASTPQPLTPPFRIVQW